MFQLASRHIVIAGIALGLVAGCGSGTPPNEPGSTPQVETEAEPNSLQARVESARDAHNLIALGAVTASSEGVLEIAVAGERAKGSADPAQPSDAWHVGSNTKALTALLYAKLVERGLADWGATMPELFPDEAEQIDPAWHDVPIEALFAHRTGMQQMSGAWLNFRRRDVRTISQQRAETARDILFEPPRKTPGEFDYNNLNYVIAGAAIEVILRSHPDLPDTWEEAMQVVLFDALDDPALRTGFGFGPPAEGLRGHRAILGAFPTAVGRGKSADNPMVLGPAGTLNASLESHAALALEFLKDDSELVPETMRAKLFTPYPDARSDYAMGWGVYEDPNFGLIYLHNGSNTMWTSRIIIAPELDRVVIVNTNQFSKQARDALRAMSRQALDQALDN